MEEERIVVENKCGKEEVVILVVDFRSTVAEEAVVKVVVSAVVEAVAATVEIAVTDRIIGVVETVFVIIELL